jgi:hypothetical protein
MVSPTPNSQHPWHRRLLYGLTNWGLFTAGAVNLAVGTWSAFNTQTAIAATSLTAGLILLFAATIDRFESLKGLGIEAKTRQLDQKIEQADDALRRVKELAEVAGASLIDLNSKMGRWNSAPTPREAYALAQRVRGILMSLGSDPTAIRRTLIPWARIACMDPSRALLAPLDKALSDRTREVERERSSVPQPIDQNDPTFLRTTASLQACSSYRQERLNRIHQLEFDDYPDRLLAILDDVPLVEPDLVAAVRDKVQEFAPYFLEVRERFQLSNPEPWLLTIESHRKHE